MLIFVSFCFCLPGAAQVFSPEDYLLDNPQSKTTSSPIKTAGDTIKGLVDKLPNSATKNGLKEYIEVLGHDKYISAVGLNNAGIASFFSARFSDSKNSCVRDAARSFYTDIAKMLRSRLPQEKCLSAPGMNVPNMPFVHDPNYGCSGITNRAGLLDVAGEKKFKNLEPGWVWRLAMKHAKGDPNSAMFLIGMCGHDDVNQGSFVYEDNSEAALDYLRELRQSFLQKKKEIDDQIKDLAKNFDLNHEHIYKLSQLASNANVSAKQIANQKSMSKTMSCPPQSSGYYAPQSLGPNADIDAETKMQVQKVQGNIDGARNIPAKYYHIYGSAFMACQLVQNGITPQRAATIQQAAAKLYRGMRMCEAANTYQLRRDSYKPVLKKYKAKNEADATLRIIKEIQQGKLNCLGNSFSPDCALIISVGYPPDMFKSGEFKISAAEIRQKVEGAFRSGDTAELYKKWYVGGGKVLGKQIPCSDVRVLGPSDLLKPEEGFFGKLLKPEGWSDRRYKMATQRLATWDIDYKWTVAQHKAGAEFAGKVCRKRADGEKPLKGICPAGPPDGETQYSSPYGSGLPMGSGSGSPAQGMQ